MKWDLRKNVPLAGLTTFRIGGPADAIACPKDCGDVKAILSREEINFTLGGGSNILVSDAGIRGTTLLLSKSSGDVEFSPERDGNTVTVTAMAWVSLTRLSGLAMRRGLSGLEFAYGIPGTVGGALVMNAGTREGEMKDVTVSVTAAGKDGVMRILTNDECGFSYRTSGFTENDVIVECEIELKKDDPDSVNKRMRKGWEARKASQPLERPSAGSVYKNPPGHSAWKLLEAAGMKGYRVGGAMVSEKHANFIVNMGGARASDALAVMKEAERRVYEQFGVALEREIKLVGEFDE